LTVLPPHLTSSPLAEGVLGGDFTYQIAASNHPYAFTATGLPAGLQLDPTTGLISGTAELSGSYIVQLTAQGATGNISATLTIEIPSLPNVMPAAQVSVTSTGRLLADVARHCIYLLDTNRVIVVDADSLSTIQAIAIPGLSYVADWCLSFDGNELWISQGYAREVLCIDLQSGALLASLKTALSPQLVRQGADGRLYVTALDQSGIFQLDSTTGATLNRFGEDPARAYPTSSIEVSPDHRFLYVGDRLSPILTRYDVSNATSPTLLQSVSVAPAEQEGTPLAVSTNGELIAYTSASTDPDAPARTTTSVRSGVDLGNVLTTLNAETSYDSVSFSADNSQLFLISTARKTIDTFDATTGNLVKSISLADQKGGPMVFQQFAGVTLGNDLYVSNQDALLVYPMVPPASPVTPAHSLLNVATRLATKTGDDVLIGLHYQRNTT
jgi:WD40 repeat protein